MNQPTRTPATQILIAVLVALGVFTIGLLIITVGLRSQGQRGPTPTPTTDVAGLPLTPLAPLAPTPTPGLETETPTPTATSTPTETPIPTDTPPAPTETPTPTPEPTPTLTPTPLPTPYAGPLRNNGGDYTAFRHDSIVVDGSQVEWSGIPAVLLTHVQQGAENLDGPQDFSVAVRMAWDQGFLYLAADVTDDAHVQALRGYEIYNGDSVELWLDTDLAGDFGVDVMNEDDFRLGFSAGDFSASPPEGVVWAPQRRGDWNAELRVAALRREGGYTLEAAIPWSILGIHPSPGMVLGYALNASDNDMPGTAAQQTILMQSPNMVWGRPTTFSNLRFQ